ncbi:zinc-dependent alcohol dehydrogenase family protein [Planococcus salinus]|uniref:NAD(P)-dependent alcohol dehydrogenase n=1 Tax=Planococcus salinus TaxID=1848460 RepID=A0A3M8P7Z7_9BACL|nr:NAD(P)-dependent alcohol dehydrogenase [Planococcus salinus]RNF39787.1 NAD(P)-dependent alcohol dehydrogenase [Planococcus salinus]
MKAWQKQDFQLENLKLVEVPTPEPKDNEILIKVNAVSLNYRDKDIMDGNYRRDLMERSFIPVSDAAGVIVRKGAEVTRFKEGDRVISHVYTKWIDGKPAADDVLYSLGGVLDGGLAEYMVLDEEAAVMAPDNLSDEEASTLPIAALTAWFSLVEEGKLTSSDTVLVHGTGGVSLFGVQLATALGARVFATTSSWKKAEKVKLLGASDVINYKELPEWNEELARVTDGNGVNYILEVVGGTNINRSINALALQGQIFIIGFLESKTAEVDLFSLLSKQAHLQGMRVGHRKAFESMIEVFEKYDIKPVIDTVYSFDQAIEAYEHLSRGAFGKIVIKVNS